MKQSIYNIACPNCMAPAEFDIVHQIYRCRYCSGTVTLEDAIQEKKEQTEQIRERVQNEVNAFPLYITQCTGCGAKLIFEENEATATCDFCKRKLVRSKYTQSSYTPENIIPFALTKEEAKEKLEDWCRNNKNKKESELLLTKTDVLKGYYLPYQMIRGPVHLEVKKKGNIRSYHAGGYLLDEFVNCSSQLDNGLLDAMEPYDLSDLKEFDYAYIAGQRVKISDLPKEKITGRLTEEVKSNYKVFCEKIWKSKAIRLKTEVTNVVDTSVLLPVYYLQDENICAAINGQTGKVSVRPIKESSYLCIPWWVEAIAVFLLSVFLTFGITYFLSKDLMQSLFITGALAFFYFFVFCFMFEPTDNNSFRLLHYREILTSGAKIYKRERGELVLRDEMLERRISRPVFTQSVDGKETEVIYDFRSIRRVGSMILLAVTVVFLPVLIALVINGFDFSKLNWGGSAVWFCITVPTAPILLIQVGLKELYENPWVYTVSKEGNRKRYYKDPEDKLTFYSLVTNPLFWIAFAVLAFIVYLTAFGF